MMPPRPIYTIAELEGLTGVSRRRIRYWIQIGLVPKSYPPEYPGEWQLPRYGKEHLTRIEKLQRWHEYKTTARDLAERIEIMGDKALDIPDVYANE